MKMPDQEYQSSQLYKLRHTAAHILAMAAKKFDPEVKLAIGPPIENGFYYDFQFSKPIGEDDLSGLEKTMAEIIGQDLPVEHKTVKRSEAIKQEGATGQIYKAELASDLTDDEVSYYGIGDFWDLCKGPHMVTTGEIKAFKLLSVAGAYWRGSEHNPMLTRIYGTAFKSKKELETYLKQLEEAKEHDHRKLGRELGIFTILPTIGSGLPVWLPKGATLYRLLAEHVRQLEESHDYQHVITSELGKLSLYKTSGHWEHYRESMYPPIELDGEEFMLRPMNCPHHISLFASELHSYRQLPIRLAEFGEVFRLEKSGELSGLQRVRAFTINDGHIFCTDWQIKDEVKKTIQLIHELYKELGLTDHWFRLSLHDPTNKQKYSKNLGLWEKSEEFLREALDEMKVKYVEAKDEAAFYGPKIDVQMKNIHGKEETISTVQLDFYLPDRFKLEYIDETGKKKQPVMIHRALLGSMERFIGFLLEKTGGELPLWLVPVQAKILPISQKVSSYAQQVSDTLAKAKIRFELDSSDETIGKRIRQAELEKAPLILVVGEREAKEKTVTVRLRGTANQSTIPLETVVTTYFEKNSLS